MSRRARALSASFFNRGDRSNPNSTPASPSTSKPNGFGSFAPVPSAHTTPPSDSPQPVVPSKRTSRAGQSRPASVIQPLMMSNGASSPRSSLQDGDVLPEMVGVFRYLGEHSQKIYHEGYFQKLNDMNPDGTPVANREWTDCYAQLIGTVLTLWDGQAIQAEEDRTMRGFPQQGGNVKPTFLNLTDASMKMIASLPQKAAGAPLQNVLSLSTAGRNRYLLHFSTPSEMTQWTAAIRVSMFEHNSLQEAYTGALIAAKGRSLNSIGSILERSKFKIEDWTRVRFGAGTPWKRYWTVISPPDEKAFQKAKKAAKKAAKQAGAQIQMPPVLGDIKFYETSKVKKKTLPVAAISSAYAAYAVYPEAKALIEQSTLIKIEGNIIIHSDPPFSSEGIIFMMPDHHAAVTGFEMLLRFLVPTYDVFNLYGRPNRLVADTIDPRSLMFSFPKETKYQYRLLEIMDVVGIINEQGSSSWSEAEWRKKLKQATSKVQLSGRGLQRANLTSPSTASLPTQLKLGSTISFDDGNRRSFNNQRPQLPTIQSHGQGLHEQQNLSSMPELSRHSSHTRSMSEAQAHQMYPNQHQGGYPQGPPPGQAYGNPPPGYISPQATGYQQQQQQQPHGLPQQVGAAYGGNPNSRPPSSKSQRSQTSQRSGGTGGQYGQQPPQGPGGYPPNGPPPLQTGYRQPAPPQQFGPGGPPSAYRGDPRAAGGFDPSIGGRQPPQLQTNVGQPYPIPAPSPSRAGGPPVPAHSFSPVANSRAMSRLSNGTLEMMHSNNAGPVSHDYYGRNPHAQPGPHRAASNGSSDTSTDSELSRDSDLAPPRPGYTTQGHRATGSASSITPNTGAIASRIPKSGDLHTDSGDLDLADELRKKQLEAATAAAARNGPGPQGPRMYAPHPQHAAEISAGGQGYGGGQYGRQEDGSARSVRGYHH